MKRAASKVLLLLFVLFSFLPLFASANGGIMVNGQTVVIAKEGLTPMAQEKVPVKKKLKLKRAEKWIVNHGKVRVGSIGHKDDFLH